MGVLEEHIIKVKHVTDAKGMQSAVAQARKAAADIEAAFAKAADGAGDEADNIADEHEKAAKKTSDIWTGALRRIGSRLADFGMSVPGKIADFVADTFEGTRELDLFAQTLGVSTSEMMALEKGFSRVRVPADATREAVKTLRENLGELDRIGTGPALESLMSLGLGLDDLKGKTPTEQLKVLSAALMNVEDPMKRTSIAIEIMGEDGQKLMPALIQGADGIDAMAQAARDAGQVLDEDMIKQTRELDDALLGMKGQAEGVALAVLQAAVPAFKDGAEGVAQWKDENQELIDQGVPAAIDLIADAASAAATVVLTLAKAIKDLKTTGDTSDVGRWMLGLQGIEVDENGNRVEAGQSKRKAASPEQQERNAALGAKRRRRAEQRRGEAPGAYGPSDAAIDEAEAARLGAQKRIEAANQRTRAARDEAELKKKPGKKGDAKAKREREQAEALEAFGATDLGRELTDLGEQVKATPKAIENALLSAMKSGERGAAIGVQRKAGRSSLSSNVGFDVSKRASRDPISEMFGIDALPDVSPADITGDRAPSVLTATINNTFTIGMDFSINGHDRPDLVPDQVVEAFEALFADKVERTSQYVKSPWSR